MKKKKMGKAIERTGILRTILLLFFEKITMRGGGGWKGRKDSSAFNSGLVTRAMCKEATGVTKWRFLVLRKNNKIIKKEVKRMLTK